MNSPALGLRVASILFALVCVAHFVRAAADVRVLIGSYELGLGVSLAATLVTGALSAWMGHLARLVEAHHYGPHNV